MVVSAGSDLYPFPAAMLLEEGPQSSEEGSGLHSPVFEPPFGPLHGDSNIRYQHDPSDVQHAANILAAQFDYSSPPLHMQQPPLLNTHLEIPNPGAHHDHTIYSSTYSLSRNQLGLGLPVQSTEKSRLPSLTLSSGGALEFNFNLSQRRLPSAQSHDHAFTRATGNMPGMTVDGDHRASASAPSAERVEGSAPKTAPRESRKESSSVVIACRQCRARKIRCDSTRPVCNNCVRRSNECQYDAVPKRRGPDKRPGTRQRSCKKRPADGSAPPPKRARKNTDRSTDDRDVSQSPIKENMSSGKRLSPSAAPRYPDRSQDPYSTTTSHTHPTNLRISTDTGLSIKNETSPMLRRPADLGYHATPFPKPFPRPLDVNIPQSPGGHHKFPLPSSPSVEYNQKVWWDSFITTYPAQEIADNLAFLVNDTGHWISFLNIEFFTKTLFDPEERLRIQPSFILSAMALATLMKSSELEGGQIGRDRALWFRDAAYNALESAWTSEWIDAQLAEAALIIALFEMSMHPRYSPDRVSKSLQRLDDIIKFIRLTSVDANDRDVCIFAPRQVPVVPEVAAVPGDLLIQSERKCNCVPQETMHSAAEYSRSYSLPWGVSWTAVQVRDEECRRLCWCALSMITTYTSQCAAFNQDPPDLFLSDPSSYCLLFPGEVLDRENIAFRLADAPSPKESVWALYCRSMLLWSFCNRLRKETVTDEEKAEFAFEAWIEAQAIEDSLDIHTCNLDTSLIYLSREHVFNTRLLITQSLRSLQGLDSGSLNPGPIFNVKQAEEWLYYQSQVIGRVTMSIPNLLKPAGQQLTRRPFQVTWFSNQLAIALLLWNINRELRNAVTLARSILYPLDLFNTLWPCEVHRQQCAELRNRLEEACRAVGEAPPPPAIYSLSHYIRM